MHFLEPTTATDCLLSKSTSPLQNNVSGGSAISFNISEYASSVKATGVIPAFSYFLIILSKKKSLKEKFNLKTSYKLARLFDTLQKESERYETLTRDAIIKYSKKDENGEPIINKGEQGESVEIEPVN